MIRCRRISNTSCTISWPLYRKGSPWLQRKGRHQFNEGVEAREGRVGVKTAKNRFAAASGPLLALAFRLATLEALATLRTDASMLKLRSSSARPDSAFCALHLPETGGG
ncbi:MAG: hypothetical protein BJ554DRAFT_7375, partial [Olpidium bornovanus]